MKKGQLVVKSHHPLRHRAMVAIIVSALLGVGWLLFDLGRMQSTIDYRQAGELRESLETQLADSKREKADLREQVAILKRTQAIDKQAYDVVRQDLKLLQEEILELREEVEFYRGIVSPTERRAGLNIQTFKIEPAGEEGLYHFELVMSQILKNDRFVKGVVKLTLHGVKSGEPLSMDFREISPNKSVDRDFRFRYFQRMEGDIRLPEGFLARSITVEMEPQKRDNISKNFAWPFPSGEG